MAGKAITALVNEVAAIDAEMASLQERRKNITAMVSKRLGKGTHTVGEHRVTVSENNTYPKDAMEALLTPGQVRRVSRLVVVPSVVKSLYPGVYEQARVEHGFKVSVR